MQFEVCAKQTNEQIQVIQQANGKLLSNFKVASLKLNSKNLGRVRSSQLLSNFLQFSGEFKFAFKSLCVVIVVEVTVANQQTNAHFAN